MACQEGPEARPHNDPRNHPPQNAPVNCLMAIVGSQACYRRKNDRCHGRAERNQREHVEIARQQRLPTANKERPAGPKHDRRAQQPLQPQAQRSAEFWKAGDTV